MTRRIVAFDTETATGGGAMHLLELGAVLIQDGEIVDRFESFVRPEVPIDPRTTAVHGIVDAQVADAEPAQVVVPRFVQWLGDAWLVAHNAPFDIAVLGFEAARHSFELPQSTVLDTVKLARRYIPESSDHKLETLTQHLDLDVDVHHRALADAVSCWMVLEECLARRSAQPEAPVGDALWTEMLAHGGSRRGLADALPRPPRMSPRLRPLEAAARERAPVVVLYGEEGPVSPLRIAPRLLFESGDKGYMEAECLRSGLLKTYRLDRVQRVLEGP